ncbi:fungal specific transcription factor [Cladophialophora carrionii]|uniref:Fungal specific transcription factor n=1 Tax=Cladophialophora carrionii TaxID=86049 RepID=A0A1C1CST5_9EURO|nr:fungal specific transcription factor [Cladophialophora carrionii]
MPPPAPRSGEFSDPDYPTKASSATTQTDSGLNQQQPAGDQDGARLSETLFTSIDDLQRQLDDFRAKLRGATVPGLSESLLLSPPETMQQKVNPDERTTRDPALVKEESNPANSPGIYAGPTSFAWGMVTADARLANLTPSSRDDATPGSPPLPLAQSPQAAGSPPFQPPEPTEFYENASLDKFSVEDVLRYLDIFQNVYGVLHAIPQLEKIRNNTPSLLRSAKRSVWSQACDPGRCGLLEMMKIILAAGLVAQAGMRTKLSEVLYRSVEPCITACAFQHTVTYDFRTLLLLVAMYHFANDDLVLRARAIMYAARTAVEEGLYRIETLTAKVPDQKERQAVVRQLWSLFVLDRQFNFAAGLPHHLNDRDVDLPAPVEAPYLAAMVSYVIMGAQGWNSLVNRNLLASGRIPSKDALNFFHYQVHHWREELDPSVRFDPRAIESDDGVFFTSTQDEREIYLKTLLYLRSNQIQILVRRPILIYPQTARNNTTLIMDAIALAKNTIRTLNTVAARTALYTTRQAIFNHFLSSALAVLFLTAAYDAETQATTGSHPDTSIRLLGDAATELQAGLDLIDRLRRSSQSAAKLWARFARPRQQLVRLGILSCSAVSQREKQQYPPHETTGHRPLHAQNHTRTDTQDYGMSGANVSTSMNAGADHHAIDFGASVALAPDFDFDSVVGAFEQDNGLLWQDWFEGGFMDSSAPFGMPAWM